MISMLTEGNRCFSEGALFSRSYPIFPIFTDLIPFFSNSISSIDELYIKTNRLDQGKRLAIDPTTARISKVCMADVTHIYMYMYFGIIFTQYSKIQKGQVPYFSYLLSGRLSPSGRCKKRQYVD